MLSIPEMCVFDYPCSAHVRRHGPRGYADDDHYKPWLRDEFSYRCLYCCCREVWYPDGDSHFSVEHILPRSSAPVGLTAYDSLVYVCCQCNAARQACELPVNPESGLGDHLVVQRDGVIKGRTPVGEDFIRICRLDRPVLTTFRRLMLDVLGLLQQKEQAEALSLCRRFLGYPINLPNLSPLRPPGGNARPQGILQSAHAQRTQGTLPEIY